PLDWAGLRDMPPAAGNVLLLVPARLAILECLREPPQRADERAHQARGTGRERRARRTRVERAEAIRETRHGPADTDAAGCHAAAHVVDRPARRDVTVHDRAPAADLDQAFLIAKTAGESPLLVVARPDAFAVDRLAE